MTAVQLGGTFGVPHRSSLTCGFPDLEVLNIAGPFTNLRPEALTAASATTVPCAWGPTSKVKSVLATSGLGCRSRNRESNTKEFTEGWNNNSSLLTPWGVLLLPFIWHGPATGNRLGAWRIHCFLVCLDIAGSQQDSYAVLQTRIESS